MARGRFISNSVITDRAVNQLSSDTCRLAFTWLITLADCEGRTQGEPELLLASLFPRRRDVTPEMMEDFIKEWCDAGFIVWYSGDDGDRYIQFANFFKHQVGLRKEREQKSAIVPPDESRIIAGVVTDELRSVDGKNRVNVNVNENVNVNDNMNVNNNAISAAAANQNAFSVYQSEIGMITSHISDRLIQDIDDYSEPWVIDAIQIASGANARNMKYIEAILSRWKTTGKDDGKQKREYQGKSTPESVAEHNQKVIEEMVHEHSKKSS